jgi:hypothetical protein
MAKTYDPNKKIRRIWSICSNPLDLVISYEDKKGRYLLTDKTKAYGRILDVNNQSIFSPIYTLSILKYSPPWYKYEGSQDILRELLSKIKYIWYTDKDSKEFKLEDYEKKD